MTELIIVCENCDKEVAHSDFECRFCGARFRDWDCPDVQTDCNECKYSKNCDDEIDNLSDEKLEAMHEQLKQERQEVNTVTTKIKGDKRHMTPRAKNGYKKTSAWKNYKKQCRTNNIGWEQ